MSSIALQPPFKVKAHYSWSGETKNDLGFIENDIIQVTKTKGDWFYGTLLRNSKKYGYFPTNFVTIIPEKYNDFKPESEKPTSESSYAKSAPLQVPPIPQRESAAYAGRKSQDSRNPRFEAMARPTRRERTYNSDSHASTDKNRAHIAERSSHAKSFERLPVSYTKSAKHNSTPNIEYARVKDKSDHKRDLMTETKRKNKMGQLPPLPPIPQLKERLKSKSSVPKSFSSNDLPNVPSNANLDTRVSYQRASADFYDGYENPHLPSDTPSTVFSRSQFLDGSLTSSEDSFALMSDFSATSAGSFARHRFARSFNDSLQRSQLVADEGLRSNNSSGAPARFNGIFKKLRSKAGESAPTSPTGAFPKLPDIASLQLSSSNNEAHDWVEAKAHLHRAQTLNSKERHERQMHALEENRDLILHPQEYVLDEINTNEVRHGKQPGLVDIELNCIDKEFIATLMKKRAKKGGTSSIESFARHTITTTFKTQIERLFAIFIFCTETFALVDDHGRTDFGKEPIHLSETLHKPYCTPYELTWIFKRMANALGIICEITIGFLKTPGADNMNFKFNHCWLRVLANGEWRLVDVILGNMTNPIHEYINNVTPDHAEASFLFPRTTSAFDLYARPAFVSGTAYHSCH